MNTRYYAGWLAGILLLAAGTPARAQQWDLVWSDEFNGDSLDLSKWTHQIGDGTSYGLPSGWGNNELQYYREENVTLRDSMLVIAARQESFGGKAYTSGRIRTAGKGDWTYGRVEFRARMPEGQGFWSAVWMLPTDNDYGGWAASGEIDIMEHLGNDPAIVHGTLHFGGSWPDNDKKGRQFIDISEPFSDHFHDFALEWEEGEIRWYIDGTLYQTQGEGDWYTTAAPFPAPFDKRFHLLINLAVGGEWPGSPDGTTEFPGELVVDYIRVYKKNTTSTGTEPAHDPEGNKLLNIAPNPFGSRSVITCRMDERGPVSLELFDAAGRKVRTLAEGVLDRGTHRLELDGAKLPSGIYTCRLVTGQRAWVRRMIKL